MIGAKKTTFNQRTSNGLWLVNFMTHESLSHYPGATTTGTPNSKQTLDNTAYGNTNDIHTSTSFKGDANLERTTTFSYNSQGLNTGSTITGKHIASRTNRITAFQNLRYPSATQNALGHTSTMVYDPRFGAVTQLTDVNNRTTKTHYDALGRVSSVVTPDNYTLITTREFCQQVLCPTVGGIAAFYRVTSSTMMPIRATTNTSAGTTETCPSPLPKARRQQTPIHKPETAFYTALTYNGFTKNWH